MASDAAAGNGNNAVRPLTIPPSASPALKICIGLAQSEIQTAVDLLGHGVPLLPPNVDDLLQPIVYDALSQSQATAEYQQTLAEIQNRQATLQRLDEQVPTMSIQVAANNGNTQAYIQNCVDALNSNLKAAGNAKLTTTQDGAPRTHR